MVSSAECVEMLQRMWRIRLFEERLKRFYNYTAYANLSAGPHGQLGDDGYDFASDGLIGGAVHLSIGQEAVSVGVCSVLKDADSIFSSHRSHGHALAKGVPVRKALAELMGREGGCCHGCGGSMHLFDPEHGMLGGNGIIGAQLALALGPAFAAKYQGTREVSVPFFGDGGANQGTFNESLNLAALWKLPVVFVCENNLYANSTPAGIALATPEVADRAAGYGMPGVVVDGQDVMAVQEAAATAVSRAREGEGPTLLECKTYRFEGHCGVSAQHQNPEECARWRQRDPLVLFGTRLAQEGVLSESGQEKLRRGVEAEIDEAESYAKHSPYPTPELLAELVL